MSCAFYPGPPGWGNRGSSGVCVAAELCPAPSALQPEQVAQLVSVLLSCLQSQQPALYLDPVLANTIEILLMQGRLLPTDWLPKLCWGWRIHSLDTTLHELKNLQEFPGKIIQSCYCHSAKGKHADSVWVRVGFFMGEWVLFPKELFSHSAPSIMVVRVY